LGGSENYATRLYASLWWTLFPLSDYRSTLTWSNRLANFGSTEVFNFYSSGEEVLRAYNEDPPLSLFGSANMLINYWKNNPPISAFAWVWQEKGKGRSPHDDVLGSTHGGWKLNSAYNVGGSRLPAAQANALPDSQLRTNAFFDLGSLLFGNADLNLYGEFGSDYAGIFRNRILADTIPALSWPVGANPVPRLSFQQLGVERNSDMNQLYQNGWPSSRPTGAEAFKWWHSDFRNVAYTYTYPLFNQFVTVGNLR
jgi:hypothetical protein